MAIPKYMEGMLSGVRILDLTRVLAGPYGSLILSDLGAEVIKIEEPTLGDTTRRLPNVEPGELTSYFISVNRNKLSMTLDLTTESGRAIFHDLVKQSDVVYNNFRPKVLTKLGCDAATLRAVNPKIITCSLSGFGQDGPYSDYPAYDLIVQAMGGGVDITGHPEGDPAVMGLHIGDQAGGMFAAISIASALYQRERTGEGRDIDLSMLDCQVSLLAFLGQDYLMTGDVPERTGTAHPTATPLRAFRTSDEKFVAVGAHAERFWPGFCRAVEKEDLTDDPRFVILKKRTENKELLYSMLDEVFVKKTSAHWLDALRREGVPCGPVNSVEETLNDPQVLHREMVVDRDDAYGQYKVLGTPIKTDGNDALNFGAPPQLGEHTEVILKERLNFTEAEVQALRERKII